MMWSDSCPSPLTTQHIYNDGSTVSIVHDDSRQIGQPTKCKRTRTGTARPQEWARSIRKRQRNSGLPYVTQQGVIKPARNMNDNVHCKCPWKCHEKLTREQRRKNYDSFYSNASWDIQTTFIAKSVKTVPVKRRKCNADPASSKKQHTREYYLQADSYTVRVCKQMFMSTLVIDSARIHRALIKGETGNFADQRGRHTPSNKIADADINTARDHISSFPHFTIGQHSSSHNPDLNCSAMYRQYTEMMKDRAKLAELNGNSPPTVIGEATYKRLLRACHTAQKMHQKDSFRSCGTAEQNGSNCVKKDYCMEPNDVGYCHDELCGSIGNSHTDLGINFIKEIGDCVSNESDADNKTGQTKRKRNSTANPQEWASTIRKKKRNSGEQYVTKRGIIKPAKLMHAEVRCKCPWKCYNKLTRDQRQKNYDSFYLNASWNIQTTYIAKSVKTVPIKRRKCRGDPGASKKQHTREFYLQADGDTVRVCKQMFMQTLVIDSARIHRALIKGASGNLADQRGRHVPSNKTANSDLDIIRQHITSFQIATGQNTRKSGPGKAESSSNLTTSAMYKAYKDMMMERHKNAISIGCCPPVTLSAATYKRILNTEFNIKFKTTRKDKNKVYSKLTKQPFPQNVTLDCTERQNEPCTSKETKEKFNCHLQGSIPENDKLTDAISSEFSVLTDWCYTNLN